MSSASTHGAADSEHTTSASPQFHRFDVPVSLLGLSVPPTRVQLRFTQQGARWSVAARVAPGHAEAARAWLAQQAGVHVPAAQGLAPRILHCELANIPSAWQAWLVPGLVCELDVGEHGIATILAHADHRAARALAFQLGTARPRAVDGTTGADLTPRQREILRNAVALGYFDVPHRIDLRGLGRSMGLSPSAACQLLRRAQAKVVQTYVNHELLAKWPDAPATSAAS